MKGALDTQSFFIQPLLASLWAAYHCEKAPFFQRERGNSLPW